MYKSIAFVILIFLCYSASSQLANTRLWRISGNGLVKPSYLYGSMHVDDERVFNFSDSLFYKLDECELFANEVAFDSLIGYIYLGFDKGVKQKMQNEYFGDDESLNEMSQSLGLDKATLKKMSPVVLKHFFTGRSKTRNRKPAVLDSYLYNVAKCQGKTCIGIEDLGLQASIYENLNPETKRDYTDYTLGKKSVMSNENMIKNYSEANMKAIEELLMLMPIEAFKSLFANRNVGMVQQIDSISRIKSVFYTIGFGHFPGDEGIINLLRKKGYRVDPIIERFTGLADKFPFKTSEITWPLHTDSIAGISIQMPGPAYNSPDFPSSIPHGICYDIGTNCLYMYMVRPVAAFGTTLNIDSLLQVFTKNAWKQDVDKEQIKHITLEGVTFSQIDKMKIEPYYVSICMGVDKESVVILIGMNNQPNEMSDISRYFSSYRKIDKIDKGWNVYHSKKGAYSILFPGNPTERLIEDKRTNSSTIVNVISDLDNKTGSEYYVQYIDNSTTYYLDDTLILENILTGNLGEIEGKRHSYDTSAIQGFPARKVHIETDNGTTLAIILCLRGTRIYNIISSYLTQSNDSVKVKHYLNSFRLTDYDYSNWTTQTSTKGNFSMIAPNSFELYDSINYMTKYQVSEAYRTFDELTGDKLTVTTEVFSPYFWTDTDSAFFKNKFLLASEEGDSLLIQRKISDDPLTWEFTSRNTANHLLTHSYIILKGRHFITAILMYPEIYENTHIAAKALKSIQIIKNEFDEDIQTPKTDLLFSHLTSNNPEQVIAAREALNFYEFKASEVQPLFQLLNQPLPDDSLETESSRVLLIQSLSQLPDSVYVSLLKAQFDNICLTHASQLEALILISKNQDMKTLDFVKEKYLALPSNTLNHFGFIWQLPDSSSYTAALYPELFSKISDTINNSFIISLTLEMLRNQIIEPNLLTANKALVLSLMQNMVQNPKLLNTYDYSTPKLFDIAGYFNDAELNAFLMKHQNSPNKYVKYNILKSLLRNNLGFQPKHLISIAKDLELRKSLYFVLLKMNKTELMPPEYRTQQSIAISEMYNILMSEDEGPEDIQYIDYKDITLNDTTNRYYLLKINYKWEDGSKESVIRIVGPYPTNESIPEISLENSAYYWSDNTDFTAAEHFEAFEKSMVEEQ